MISQVMKTFDYQNHFVFYKTSSLEDIGKVLIFKHKLKDLKIASFEFILEGFDEFMRY